MDSAPAKRASFAEARTLSLPLTSELNTHTEIVIIGAGIMGLSIAYNLARLLRERRAKQRILVLDEGYLCGGASGRNGGGVRAQWSSEKNVRLMQESLALCKQFAREHQINTWFREGGYLFVTRSEEKGALLEQSVRVQNECGLGTQLLSAEGARGVVPELDASQIRLASYNPKDAVVFPWPFVWGYAESAKRYGVEIYPFTQVQAIETGAGRVQALHTNRGKISAELVVNATGALAPRLAQLAGVELPNHPHRHEICASEPLKAWLEPLVADLDTGLYFSQSTRGEIVGGVHVAEPSGSPTLEATQESSARFLAVYARAITSLCPSLERIKVLRQWAGFYDISPDANPIVGPVDELPNFIQVCGFMGHGFMMAPAVGRRLAKELATGVADPIFQPWNLRRFARGEWLSEGLIIG